jgi:hypothetical protein
VTADELVEWVQVGVYDFTVTSSQSSTTFDAQSFVNVF